MGMWGLWARRCALLGCAALAGCSFVIELDGPGFVDAPEMDDSMVLTPIDSFTPDVPDMAIVDAEPDEAVVDRGPPVPELNRFMLALDEPAVVVVHTETGQVREAVEAAATHELQVADGDALTVLFQSPPALVSVFEIEAGGAARIDRPAHSSRSTSMRVQLNSRFPDAAGYAITNGCRHLRCAGVGCDGWFEGAAMSLAVTERCTQMDAVRTVVLALDGDEQPIGWAVATDPFPETSNATPSFGSWDDALSEVPLIVDGLDDARVFGAPWLGLAYDADLAARRTDSGRTVRLPRTASEIAMFGLDFDPPDVAPALGRATQGVRVWRRAQVELPVVFRADRLPGVPTVVLRRDSDGHRPRIRWRLAEDAPEPPVLAQVEYAWENVLGTRIPWTIYAPGGASAVRLPILPDDYQAWRPPVDAPGLEAQVTLVDCQGVTDLATIYAEGCPLFAPSASAPLHREVRWAAGHARPMDEAPDEAMGD